MYYENVLPIKRHEAKIAFSSKNAINICDALLRITYHDSDWQWVQSYCLYFSKHTDIEVRRLAITCIGHLARIHGLLDLQLVNSLLNELINDPEVHGYVQNALDDISIYVQ